MEKRKKDSQTGGNGSFSITATCVVLQEDIAHRLHILTGQCAPFAFYRSIPAPSRMLDGAGKSTA